MLNRSVVIVRVKEPFMKWLQSLPEQADVTIDEVNSDNTAYLLPDLEYDDDVDELIERYHDLIFEEQLNGWGTDKSSWPTPRDVKMFKKWFDCEFHSIVLDLVDQPLSDE